MKVVHIKKRAPAKPKLQPQPENHFQRMIQTTKIPDAIHKSKVNKLTNYNLLKSQRDCIIDL